MPGDLPHGHEAPRRLAAGLLTDEAPVGALLVMVVYCDGHSTLATDDDRMPDTGTMRSLRTMTAHVRNALQQQERARRAEDHDADL